MSTDPERKTVVVSIRINSTTKERLENIACAERRTFAAQAGLALDEWLIWCEAKKAEKTADGQ